MARKSVSMSSGSWRGTWAALLGTHESDNDVEAGSEKRGCCTLSFMYGTATRTYHSILHHIYSGALAWNLEQIMYDYKLPIDFYTLLFLGIPRNSCHAPTTQRVSNKARLFMFEHLTDEQLVINLKSPLFETSHDLIWWSVMVNFISERSSPICSMFAWEARQTQHLGNCADGIGMRALYNSKTTIQYHVLVQNCLFIEISLMTLEEWLLSMKAAKFTFASHISYFGTHKFPGNHVNAV